MKRITMMAAFAVLAFSAPAFADEASDLKPQALEACKKEMGFDATNPGNPANAETEKLCGCMVDNIVTVFGDDAAKMLKLINAGLNPSQTAEIATTLGISEDEAKAFVEVADAKMNDVQKACMPAEAAPAEAPK
jgi:hypothetical protein